MFCLFKPSYFQTKKSTYYYCNYTVFGLEFMAFDTDNENYIICNFYKEMQQLYWTCIKPRRWSAPKAWSGTAGVNLG